jgi:hypothetical protein
MGRTSVFFRDEHFAIVIDLDVLMGNFWGTRPVDPSVFFLLSTTIIA